MKNIILAHLFIFCSWIVLFIEMPLDTMPRVFVVLILYVVGISLRVRAGIGEGIFKKVHGDIPRHESIAMDFRTCGAIFITVGMSTESGVKIIFEAIFSAIKDPICILGFILYHACYVIKDVRIPNARTEQDAEQTASSNH